MTKSLAGRVALVTGATRGIGAATAEALALAGAHVLLTGRTEGALEEVEARIHAAGGTATIAPLDLRETEQIDRLAQAVGSRWGKLDILVLNAAILGDLMPVSHMAPKEFDKLFALNLGANQALLRAFDGLLRASEHGRVIALSSSVAVNPRAYWGAYAASKAALDMLIACYGEEVRNISATRVAIVDPGATQTRMRAKAFPGEDAATLKAPSVVADAILGLLVDDFETGVRIVVPR